MTGERSMMAGKMNVESSGSSTTLTGTRRACAARGHGRIHLARIRRGDRRAPRRRDGGAEIRARDVVELRRASASARSSSCSSGAIDGDARAGFQQQIDFAKRDVAAADDDGGLLRATG